jgi:predicted PurR-regulated permease PerM
VSTRSEAGVLLFRSVLVAAGVMLAAFLLWSLRGLIVPVVTSGLLAYLCRPLVTGLERHRIPRPLAVAMLATSFVAAIAGAAIGVRAVVPTELGTIELKVRLLYELNRRYEALMELDPSLTGGNQLYRWVHVDSDPLLRRVTDMLTLSSSEREKLVASRRGAGSPARPDIVLDEDRANVKTLQKRTPASGVAREDQKSPATAPAGAPASASDAGSGSTLVQALSAWLIAPLIFLFLLRDTGQIKRGLLSVVPNELFEPALTVMADLDDALGDWARGLFLECSLFALTLTLLLGIVGIPWRWAVVIGFVGGASNVIPFLGVVVALLAALAYALVAEGVHPLLAVMGDGASVALWVVAALLLAELIKNAVYEPVVLGGAVKLHPLVVVLGAAGGAVLFGFAGLLLAVPAIVIFKVFVSSTARQLKAYGLV